MSRRDVIRRRWLEVLWWAVVGASILLLGGPFAIAWLDPQLEEIPAWALIPASILVVALLGPHFYQRRSAALGVRFLFTYPARWVAALPAVLCLGLFFYVVPDAAVPFGFEPGPTADVQRDVAYSTFILMCPLAALTLLAWKFGATFGPRVCRRRLLGAVDSEQDESNKPPLANNFFTLANWLEDDREIRFPSQDRFGHNQIATRIVDRIVSSSQRGRDCPSIALVGELGAGKTSILSLVRYHLARRKMLGDSVTLVSLSLWPFDTPEAAIRGVLAEVNNELRYYASTLSIAGLPRRYVDAIESAGSFWSALSVPLRKKDFPSQMLAAYGDICQAIHVRMVLWIEDFERFARSEAADADALESDSARLSAIRALLHTLDGFPFLTVVMSTTSLHARFDIEKVARFVEKTPTPTSDEMTQLFQTFRRGALSMLDGRVDLHAQDDPLRETGQWSVTLGIQGPPTLKLMWQQLAEVCRTPRVLKQGMRSALETWQKLVGEIDFDDVLVLSMLRVAEPNVFALIDESVHRLKQGPGISVSPEIGESEESDFDRALKTVLPQDDSRRLAIFDLMDRVFPYRNRGPGSFDVPTRPQGVGIPGYPDYWRRFMAAAEVEESERDQPTLREIVAYEDEVQSNLAELMSSKAQVVERFGRLLSPASILRLLREVTELRAAEHPDVWPEVYETPEPPGMVPLWRLCARRGVDQEALSLTLIDLLESTAHRNLSVSVWIANYFASEETGIPQRLSQGGRQAVRECLQERLHALAQSPKTLVRTLQGAFPNVLLHASWGLHKIREGRLGNYPFEGWSDFALALLAGFSESPATILSQILPFFVPGKEHPIDPQPLHVDEEAAERLFGVASLRALQGVDALSNEQIQSAVRDRFRVFKLWWAHPES
jgi:hypothetical protein